MANPVPFPGDINVPGVAYLRGGIQPAITRASLAQDSLRPYAIPLTDFVTWNAMGTPLPSAGAADDLGLVGGTFATDSPSLQTGDLKAAGATSMYGRVQARLPAEYVDGETVVLRFSAGMITNPADVSATLDVEAFESDGEAGISADLCATAATTINSVTFDNTVDFSITATALAAGDMLDVRITVAVNDAATGTAVIGCVGSASLLCDVKG